jgi:hypothetical protein
MIDGVLSVGEDLSGHYSYEDKENNPMDHCTLTWYKNSSASDAGKTQVGTGNNYTLQAADITSGYIGFGVTPIASEGNMVGAEVIYWVDLVP